MTDDVRLMTDDLRLMTDDWRLMTVLTSDRPCIVPHIRYPCRRFGGTRRLLSGSSDAARFVTLPPLSRPRSGWRVALLSMLLS
jgi:hypothetical protein